VAATQEIFDLLKTTTAEDLVIALISGGGSALLSHPAAPISLSDLQELTQNLLASGADIQSINTLRKHLDLAKGGGLALAASPAALATLILSDVVGDPLDMIASGPTVPDPTHFSDAIAVLEQHQLWSRTPKSIRKRLEQGLEGVLPETLKPGHPVFRRVSNHLIATNRDAAEAAQRQAQSRGMDTRILTLTLTGEARTAGRWLVQEGRKIGPVSQPVCLIAGGETTVTLTPDAGLGGRNQELALAALLELTIEDQPMLLVTLATDGGDGPTDAAGAVVAANSRARALEFGLDAGLILENHNAYTFFDTLDDLLKPGPTRTNVNDLAFVFCFPG
jgi:hydroxypyruvate reductase